MAKDLILEIGTEEMPSSAVYTGIDQLKKIAEQMFKKEQIGFKKIESFATPRRFVLKVEALASKQDDIHKDVKGPPKEVAYSKEGEPTAQALGFAQSQGVKVDALVVRTTPKGDYVFAVKKEPGKNTQDLLKEILPELITSLSFPKSMRWEETDFNFVRPIRWILALFGGSVIDFSLAGVKSGNATRGHHILKNQPFSVKSAKNYFEVVKSALVVIDQGERRELILNEIEKEAAKKQGKAVIDDKTIDEVVNLVEDPQVVWGSYSPDYLALPDEVLITSMESHQRYFPMRKKNGSLMSNFIVIHNGDKRCESIIQKGHERVLGIRLADAEFFFKEDQKVRFVKYVDKLKGVIFQEQLGTLFDKVKRLKLLSKKIAQDLGFEKKEAERAAWLSKADLVTHMVTEFPDLQGVMGRVYASLSNEPKDVCTAIFEHYLPRFSGDVLPQSEAGKVLSMADKLDTIAGCFIIGLVPTGSEDPYSLRRHAQGIINIILSSELSLSLNSLIDFSLKKYGRVSKREYSNKEAQELIESLFRNRLRTQLSNEGFKYDICDAVLVKPLDNILDLRNRVKTISEYRDKKDMEDLLTAFNRCKNLREPKAGTKVRQALLKEEEEKKLVLKTKELEESLILSLDKEDIDGAIRSLAALRSDVDIFFDEVLVMDKDKQIRNNRLAMLNWIYELYMQVADFSKIVVEN